MNIFNTKKVQMEWEQKIENSYLQGKNDAIDEALASVDKSNRDKEEWEKLSDKELMLEIMNSLSLHNQKLEHMNDKINFILDYKLIFKEINEKIAELNKVETELFLNIEDSKKHVSLLNESTKSIIDKSKEINDTLGEVLKIKVTIETIIENLKRVIPDLENTCYQINDIAENMNDIVEQYSDSPMTIINEIRTDVKNINKSYDSLYFMIEDIETKVNGIDSNLISALDEDEYDSLYYKLNDIESKVCDIESNVSNSLDEYGYSSLYYKLNHIESKVCDIESNVSNSLDEYGYSSLYSILDDIKNKIDNSNSDY